MVRDGSAGHGDGSRVLWRVLKGTRVAHCSERPYAEGVELGFWLDNELWFTQRAREPEQAQTFALGIRDSLVASGWSAGAITGLAGPSGDDQ